MLGKFIVFEGLDGSGISTQSGLLYDYFSKKGKKTVLTKEQTNGLIGGLIKAGLRHEWKTTPLALQLLFAADRSHHLDKQINPAINNGKIVICDRYILSTLAFGSLDVDMQFLKEINSKFPAPDITFILDVLPKICLQRITKSRFHAELFEEEEKLNKIRKAYLSLKNYFPNTFVIDGNRSIEEVHKDIVKIVEEQIKEK
ncbi:MAG: dTMP kinase [Candidatus Aenigmarchaeota archaeon]|nr:dTMP kinase [Candidatus Aenigmarchaeota archaeon]